MFVEINFRKSKWLVSGPCHPPSQIGQCYFDFLDQALDVYSSYEKIVITEGFDAQFDDEFLYQLNLSNLVKESTLTEKANLY